MDLSPSSLRLLLFVVLVTLTCTWAQGREPCTTRSGGHGRCVDIRSCPTALANLIRYPPSICRFEGRFPIVCCPVSSNTEPGGPGSQLVDVSPPRVSFDCGISSPRTIFFPNGQPLSAGVALRPGHELALARATFLRPAVVGGENAQINAWPWMALVGEKQEPDNNWFCAGVLINEQWVLSALHCFLEKTAEVVRLGEHDYNSDDDGASPLDFSVAQTVLYPDHIYPQAYHDLALLKLATKVNIQRTIRPACLPWGDDIRTDLTGSRVTLAGWGTTVYGGFPSSTLQDVKVEVFPSSRCDQSYSSLASYSTTWPQGIGNETLCAGDNDGGRDACQGDSGGPLVSLNSRSRYTVAAIVSRGYGCAHKDYPGLYANLRHPAYLAWIKKTAF